MATQRLFFAISLPDEMQQQLVHWRADNFPAEAGQPVVAANLHLTLAFLGEVAPQTSQQLQTLASRIIQPGFDLDLDDAGHWPRPGVVWLGCRFIHISRCYAMPLSRLRYRHAAFTGVFTSPRFPCLPLNIPGAAPAIALWPAGH